jgi:hypothetical protein
MLGAAARVELWSLTDRQLAVEVADARGLARSRGASSTVAWLRGSHRLSCAEASRLVKTARALREQLPATATR